MASPIEPRTLKGFRDYGPKEQLARQAMLTVVQNAFERFGFLPMSTPVLEYKDILLSKYGDDEKLVYTFTDMGGREVAMRYDLTVPLARFVAQNKGQIVFPLKRYQIGPSWRADNTQRGRLREFIQCDIDTVGTRSDFFGTADAEIIACLAKALEDLGVDNFLVRVNDRRMFELLTYDQADRESLREVLRCVDKLDKIGLSGVVGLMKERGVSQELALKVEEVLQWGKGTETLENLSKINDEGAAQVNYWRKLLDNICALGVPQEKVVFDPTVTRGLDYYTSTVFEFGLTGVEGYGSIAGGGRYNDLLSSFGNASIPAVGGSLGFDRLYEYMQEQGRVVGTSKVDVVIFNMSGNATWVPPVVLGMASELRLKGVNVDLYFDDAKLEQQFKYAENKNAKFAVLYGEEEQSKGVVKVKDLATRDQQEVGVDNLSEFLLAKLEER